MIATDIRTGNFIQINGKPCKVLSQEMRGSGKFGKTVHLRIRDMEGRMHEKSLRAEEKVEEVEYRRVKMQFLYRDNDQFFFMNMEDYEQFPISEKVVGKEAIFLKENSEIDVDFVEGKPVSIDYPKIVELKVVSAPPANKGGGDSTYKEVELENGLMLLTPQFIKEGETVRVNTEDLSYLDRLTTKSLNPKVPPQ
ncbi:MAG: elongation factor P [Candidatus Omnitrophota bacterium]|nr:elongation factor P [Candidatus Omnitrophota bacterium]